MKAQSPACYRTISESRRNTSRRGDTGSNWGSSWTKGCFPWAFSQDYVSRYSTLFMKYHQRDIVEVSFLFPDGTFKPHPAIIVSNDQLQEDEDGMFYLVLITSNDWLNPQYSYPLSDEMVDGFTFSKPSLVKCQIISGNIERDVNRRLGSIKQQYFDEIVDKIVESIFWFNSIMCNP